MARPHRHEQVLLDDVGQRLVVELDEARRCSAGERAHVVDGDVEPAELGDDPVDQPPHLGGLAQIGRNPQHPRAGSTDLLDRLGERLDVLVGDDDVAAGLGEPSSDPASDADGAPGDERPLPSQPEVDRHGHSPGSAWASR